MAHLAPSPSIRFLFQISHLQHRILGPDLLIGVVGGEVLAVALFADGGAYNGLKSLRIHPPLFGSCTSDALKARGLASLPSNER